jgi:hypothetical protein
VRGAYFKIIISSITISVGILFSRFCIIVPGITDYHRHSLNGGFLVSDFYADIIDQQDVHTD